MRSLHALIKLCILATVFTPNAMADVKGPDSDWQLELSPVYLWAININSDIGLLGRTGSTQVKFGSIEDNFVGAFTVRFSTIYNDRLGVMLDYSYTRLSTENINDEVNTGVGFLSQFLNQVATYCLLSGSHTVDSFAVIRYTFMDVDNLYHIHG